MDVSQIASLATDLSNMRTSSEASTLVMKKALDNQEAVAAGILKALPLCQQIRRLGVTSIPRRNPLHHTTRLSVFV